MKKSTFLGIILFVIFLPTWIFLTLQDYIANWIMLAVYPFIIIPLYILMKKYENKEREIEELK